VKAGQVVQCGATRSGARCYLSVRGGIAAPKVMGGASVHVMTGVGDRALRAGEVLPIGNAAIRRPHSRSEAQDEQLQLARPRKRQRTRRIDVSARMRIIK
jgi:allophanate hydrolase subunit 2